MLPFKIRFQAEAGWFGEKGWQDIGFWKWFKMALEGGWCIRVRVERKRSRLNERSADVNSTVQEQVLQEPDQKP